MYFDIHLQLICMIRARVEEITAHIGDMEPTIRRYYIAVRLRARMQGIEKQIVLLPVFISEKK